MEESIYQRYRPFIFIYFFALENQLFLPRHGLSLHATRKVARYNRWGL